jgi:hypothetical protein
MRPLMTVLLLWACLAHFAAYAQEERSVEPTFNPRFTVRAGGGALPLMAGAGAGCRVSQTLEYVIHAYRIGVSVDVDARVIAPGVRVSLNKGTIVPFWCFEGGPAWLPVVRRRDTGFESAYQIDGAFVGTGLGYALNSASGFIASLSLRLCVIGSVHRPPTGGAGLIADLGWSF